ncbi:hypothetical protein ACW0JT_08185 [Arthrobacter sp. SA17]
MKNRLLPAGLVSATALTAAVATMLLVSGCGARRRLERLEMLPMAPK